MIIRWNRNLNGTVFAGHTFSLPWITVYYSDPSVTITPEGVYIPIFRPRRR